MQTFIRLTALGMMLSLSTITAREPVFKGMGSPENDVSVTIIYDNYQEEASLETDWGFACLVEYQNHQLLFDAGRDSELYKKNVKLLQIKPEEIPSLFISHKHGDHTAGMPWITEINPSVKCYLPATFEADLKANDRLPQNSIGLSKPTHLYGPFYSTGDDFKSFNEQGLVVKTENGGVLITGCGHPGPIDMVKVAEEKLGIEIHTVIGGLHLLQTSQENVEEIAEILKKIGVRQICPTHCTGDNSIAALKAAFGEGYISGGTGKVIIIK